MVNAQICTRFFFLTAAQEDKKGVKVHICGQWTSVKPYSWICWTLFEYLVGFSPTLKISGRELGVCDIHDNLPSWHCHWLTNFTSIVCTIMINQHICSSIRTTEYMSPVLLCFLMTPNFGSKSSPYKPLLSGKKQLWEFPPKSKTALSEKDTSYEVHGGPLISCFYRMMASCHWASTIGLGCCLKFISMVFLAVSKALKNLWAR